MTQTRNTQILALAEHKGVLRARDLDPYGIPHSYLSRLTRQGLLQRIERGVYVLPDAPITTHHSLAEAATRVPNGVVCLLSALNFHQLTTQTSFEIWLAIGNKAWKPQVEALPLRFVRFSGPAYTEGIEVYTVDGVPVKIYEEAKTVADCFKYRHKIGLDLCLEALRNGLRRRKFSVDQLSHFAKICRVHNIIKPYIEAML
jgi:predicted transcriptional regulator of viral defense system